MTVYCQGKQGAAVYITVDSLTNGDVKIYEPSRDLMFPPKWGLSEKRDPKTKTFLFESTPLDIRDETFLNNASEFATWKVYTSAPLADGRIVEVYRGARGKLNSQSFVVNNIWQNGAFSSRLQLAGSAGIFQSWIYARASWISRIEFSHGNIPIYSRNMYIYSAEGFLANTYSQTRQFLPPNLDFYVHCGCEHGMCQQGSFPLKYCCFDCGDSKRWLKTVRDDAEFYKHAIQDKLLLPRTYNPRTS